MMSVPITLVVTVTSAPIRPVVTLVTAAQDLPKTSMKTEKKIVSMIGLGPAINMFLKENVRTP